MIEQIEVSPNPRRLIEGLRDTGYEFNTAIADIIDNSIAAEAGLVSVNVKMDYRGSVHVSIADNGHGMSREELVNAMRYGSDQRPNPASLGKFGLGLKTASTAFCRKLSVTSQRNASGSLSEATWDLDHVSSAGLWELLLSDQPEKASVKHLELVAPDTSGTVVVWTNIDRLTKDYAHPGGAHAQKALAKIVDDLKAHVAMVYQRFLDHEDDRAPNTVIRINGEPILAWDPFCIKASDVVGEKTVPVDTGARDHAQFTVRAYILPRKEEFKSEREAKDAKISNERQGIYIYRENRLIHEADWLGMFSKEPHGSLLRVEFSFDNKLDAGFHIDIKKSQIILNDDLWKWLKEFLTAPRREANSRYRQGQRRKAKDKAVGSHDRSNRNIRSKEQELDTPKVTVLDPKTGDCELVNRQGQFKLKLPVSNALKPGEVYVQAVDGLDDNLLFEPTIIDGHKAVRINTAHPYYQKVYIPNLSQGVTIQGMDSLLWSLCVAEFSTISNETQKHFEEMRFEVSRLLRRLVEDLPEPDLNEDRQAA